MVHCFGLHGKGGARVSGAGPEPPLNWVISSVSRSLDHSTGDTSLGMVHSVGVFPFIH